MILSSERFSLSCFEEYFAPLRFFLCYSWSESLQRDISKGGIFIVSTNAGLFVKRVSLKTDGSLELISDNKSYNSEIISQDELESIELLGRVIGKVGLV